jgi:hypothetical protein
MVVAVIAVRMVQVPGNMIIDVVAVWHRFMAATRAMGVVRFVTAAAMTRGAAIRIAAGYADHMLVDMAFVRMVKMAVMQVVDVIAVAHGRVPATGPMLMSVMRVVWFRTSGHGASSFLCPEAAGTAVRLSAA